jgi:hypothetical protein
MTTFEISSNLTTEEIKEKIREIGYFRYPILREKRFLLILIIFWLLMGWLVFMDKSKMGNIQTDSLFAIIMTFGVFFPGFWLLISHRNSNKNKEMYDNIIWFLEAVIYSRNIINLKYQKLLILTSTDTIEKEIDPNLVIQIKTQIQEITHIIQAIDWMDWNILKTKKYSHIFNNEEEYVIYLHLFTNQYNKDIYVLYSNIEKSIQDWIAIHAEELEKLEENIKKQSIELWSGHLVIQDIRLRSYLDNLKNTVNSI